MTIRPFSILIGVVSEMSNIWKYWLLVKILSPEKLCCEKCIDVSDEPGAFIVRVDKYSYEGWNFNSGNYLFTTDTK